MWFKVNQETDALWWIVRKSISCRSQVMIGSIFQWFSLISWIAAELQEKGVTCTDNSSEVAQSVHILFLCVLPSQFPSLALDIRGHIQKHCIVYSFIPTIPLFKLRNMLDFTNVVHPVYECNSHKHWDYTEDITAVFANPVKLEHTCPLTLHREGKSISELCFSHFLKARSHPWWARNLSIDLPSLLLKLPYQCHSRFFGDYRWTIRWAVGVWIHECLFSYENGMQRFSRHGQCSHVGAYSKNSSPQETHSEGLHKTG